jgi:hypothetical protein
MVCAGEDVHVPAGAEFDLVSELESVWSLTHPLPVVDWYHDTAPPIPALIRDAGFRSSLYVAIQVEQAPWGRLVVHDRQTRHWRQVEIDFIQSLANVLATRVESDTGRTIQAAVAEFGSTHWPLPTSTPPCRRPSNWSVGYWTPRWPP